MAGRKTKLTPEIADALEEMLVEGVPVKLAVEAVGVDESTFYKWKKDAELYEIGETDPSAYSSGKRAAKIYFEFFQRIKKAQTRGMVKAVKKILADDRPWQAFAWYLERMRPDLFGKDKAFGEEVKAFMEEVLGVIEGVDPDVRTKIERALIERRALRGALVFSSSSGAETEDPDFIDD